MTVTVIARVPSLTRTDRAYDIVRYGQELTCSCPAFTMGKKKGTPCKHLHLYLSSAILLARCYSAHGGDATRLCQACLIGLLAASARKVKKRYRLKPVKEAK